MSDLKKQRKWVAISRWIFAIPRILQFYKKSPVFLAKQVFRVWRQEGLSGIKRRMNVFVNPVPQGEMGVESLSEKENTIDIGHEASPIDVPILNLNEKENVIVVSHEASRTGAPILSLNLARVLGKRYNVLVLVLGGGPLLNAFRDTGAAVLELPITARYTSSSIKQDVDQLLQRYHFKFAVVNSIESRAVLPVLAEKYIPSISLLHEFASYTRPRDAFRQAFFWSGDTIFSTKLTLQNAFEQYPDLNEKSAHVLPQGRCALPEELVDLQVQTLERTRLQKALRPAKNGENVFVVLGAGYVQLRKGVDLFIACAAKVLQLLPAHNIRFVWIGKGYDSDNDVHYSVYLNDQIKRAGLEDYLTFIDETSEMDEVYRLSDLLLLTSRLDPLPNVAIDALSEGLPVMCFQCATGIADILVDQGLQKECVAGYLDIQELAEKIVRLANDKPLYKNVSQKCKQIAVSTFQMEHYVQRLEKLVNAVATQADQERKDFIDILKADVLNTNFCSALHHGERPMEEVVREYVRAWASGVDRRKPFPGFHPGVYRELHGLRDQGADPLADYIRSGAPAGEWLLPVIHNKDKHPALSKKTRVALHLHIFYPDLLPDILTRLNKNTVCPDLFISTNHEQSAKEVRRQLENYNGKIQALEVVPNRGRDIGPLLTAFGSRIASDYEFVGHLHTKKTADIKDASMGATWYRFLLENLLGGDFGAMMDSILGFMATNSKIGMVFPDDPNVVGWGANKSFALDLAGKLGIEALPDNILFPVGSMFWARVDALENFFKLNLQWDDYPEEPLPYDGSLLHAIERLFPMGLVNGVNQCAVTYVERVSR